MPLVTTVVMYKVKSKKDLGPTFGGWNSTVDVGETRGEAGENRLRSGEILSWAVSKVPGLSLLHFLTAW